MHINVSHILAGEVGTSADFTIEGEYPNIPDLELTKPIAGSVSVTKLDQGLGVRGTARLVFKLECSRCLDPYEHTADLSYQGSFSDRPGDDEWPISARGQIDLVPLIRQEALVAIPIQQLCKQDCAGLCADCGRKLDDGHQHDTQEPRHQPRIVPLGKKGQ